MAVPRAAVIPRLIYGTAWKKSRTRTLVKQALSAGFRAIDTAAQPKHYEEHLVGQAIRDGIGDGIIGRENVYLQTKFTSVAGQDTQNLPYEPKSCVADQVRASVASSLRNLRHTANDMDSYLDCVLLHSPLPTISATLEAWTTLESFVPQRIRTLGISNVGLPLLHVIYKEAAVKPTVVQNRFYRDTGYDKELRAFCEEKQITYQAFWTLTANPHLLRSTPVKELAEVAMVSIPAALYALVSGLGECITILNGTTNKENMRDDLAGMQVVQSLKDRSAQEWQMRLDDFRRLLE